MIPRRLLRTAARAAVCAALIAAPAAGGAVAQARALPGHRPHASARLPVRAMERILQATGHVSHGVLAVDIDRGDLHVRGPHRVRFVKGFQIQHELYFQSLGHGRAALNGDLALRRGEIQPAIDALLAHHLVLQAEHQHFYNLSPMVWFIHFRGTGSPLRLAREIHAVIREATRTRLPQRPSAHRRTPLPVARLARILGGEATVGGNGVVTVDVERANPMVLGGHRIKPGLGVATEIQFEPLPGGRAAAVPDFGMTAREVQPVVRTMRRRHWEVGCLYNQETAEHPQLYYAHMFRTGDPVALAREIRRGLRHMDMRRRG